MIIILQGLSVIYGERFILFVPHYYAQSVMLVKVCRYKLTDNHGNNYSHNSVVISGVLATRNSSLLSISFVHQ